MNIRRRLCALAILVATLLAASVAGAEPTAVPAVKVNLVEMGDRVKIVADWKGAVKHAVRSGSGVMVLELSPAKLAAGSPTKFPVQRGLIGVVQAVQSTPSSVQIRIPVLNTPVHSVASRGANAGVSLTVSTLDVARGTGTPTAAAKPAAASPKPAASASPKPAAASPRPAASASPKPAAAASPKPAAAPSPKPTASKPAAAPTPPTAQPPEGTKPAAAEPAPAPQPAPAPAAAPAPSAPTPADPPSVALAPNPGGGSLPAKEYTMILQDQDLRVVLSELAADMGLKAVIDPAVEGRVTAVLMQLDSASALEAVLNTQKAPNAPLAPYGWAVVGNELRVGPKVRTLPRAATPAAAPAAAAPSNPVAAPSTTATATYVPPVAADPNRVRDYFPIAGKKAQEVADAMKLLVPGAHYAVDERVNILLVEGSAADVEQVRKLMAPLMQQ